ncbi:hypothetical protein OAF26_01715 [Akkermansiaceae bacterium]|nr:hypothetical protein [Akkermansiaceae bacterium]|tara:strand:+ start:3291 stop:3776 length:486 start_codon:yes stop_codon:yes gene_type:complete
MDILKELDPQAILVLLMVIFAAIKAFFEKRKKGDGEVVLGEETDPDLYQAYEEELARQRSDLQLEISPPTSPPPLSEADPFSSKKATPPTPLPAEPVLPKLSAAEKQALKALEARTKKVARKARDTTKSRVYRHLSSPTAAREALLLAEILGPPKAMQEKV